MTELVAEPEVVEPDDDDNDVEPDDDDKDDADITVHSNDQEDEPDPGPEPGRPNRCIWAGEYKYRNHRSRVQYALCT